MSFILILLFSLSALAQKHIVVMGGGGEPAGTGTIFDDGMKTLGKYFDKNKDWNVEVSFNGGHSGTEQIIASGIGRYSRETTSFTEQNYRRLIDEYKQKIQNGEIKQGEQLLIFINTHGAQAQGYETTHAISTSEGSATNLNTLAGASLVSLDALESLTKLANSKGVKLGIIDSSCHSGNTIKLKNPSTCVITASGPNHFGYSSFGESLASHMKKGKNLEDVFMDTFTDRDETAFPMISTAAGIKLQEDLYPLLTPYLYSYNAEHDKLKSFIEKQVMENKCDAADENYQKILQLSQEMEKVLKGKGSDFRRFQEAITDYHQYQNKIRNDLLSMGVNTLTQKESFCSDGKPDDCLSYSIKEILSMDIDAEIARNERFKEERPAMKDFVDTLILRMKKIKNRKAELIATHPEYKRYVEYYQKEVPKFQDESWDKALAVSKALQRIYERSYRTLSSQDTTPNPCRDFVL